MRGPGRSYTWAGSLRNAQCRNMQSAHGLDPRP